MDSSGGSWNSGDGDAGTGGVRDSYTPDSGRLWEQTQRTADLEREERAADAARPGLVARILAALRGLITRR